MEKCSFCGKSQAQVGQLVQGPAAAICDECIRFFHEEVLPDSDSGAQVRERPSDATTS